MGQAASNGKLLQGICCSPPRSTTWLHGPWSVEMLGRMRRGSSHPHAIELVAQSRRGLRFSGRQLPAPTADRQPCCSACQARRDPSNSQDRPIHDAPARERIRSQVPTGGSRVRVQSPSDPLQELRRTAAGSGQRGANGVLVCFSAALPAAKFIGARSRRTRLCGPGAAADFWPTEVRTARAGVACKRPRLFALLTRSSA